MSISTPIILRYRPAPFSPRLRADCWHGAVPQESLNPVRLTTAHGNDWEDIQAGVNIAGVRANA